MRTILFVLILPFLATSVANASGKIAIVNYAEIENKALVSQDISKQIQDRQSKLQTEVKAVQDDVQKKVAELEKSSAVLAAKALDAKKVALQKELMQIDSNLKSKAQKLENIKNESLVTLNNQIKDIVESISKKQGYDIVISENAVLYFQPTLDITSEVIKELDAKMPKMRIDWEASSTKKK